MFSRLAIFAVGLMVSGPAWPARYAVERVFQGGHPWNGEGRPALAVFLHPQDITVDSFGNLFVIHNWGRLVVKIGVDGIAHRVAGGGVIEPGNGVKATDAALFARGIVVDASGAIYVSDSGRYRIYRIGTDGRIAVYAGTGIRGFSGDNGPATEATLMNPIDMAMDAAGNLYFADSYRVRRITPGGTIRTVAGNGSSGAPIEGAVATATPISVQTLAVEQTGTVLIAPLRAYPIFRVGADGILRKLAGGGSSQAGSATAAQAYLDDIKGIAAAPDGAVYCTQLYRAGRLRKIAGGMVTTVAGAALRTISGDGGDPATANLSNPGAVHVDAAGDIWFIDHLTVRRVSRGRIETVAGSHEAAILSDGGPLAESQTRRMTAITRDRDGFFYIADGLTHSVYRVSPDRARIQRIAGTGFPGFTTDAGAALQVPLNGPQALDVDSAGNVYVGEGARVRKLSPGGQLQSIAGINEDEDFTEGALAVDFYVEPASLRLGPSGDLYVASRRRIFRIGTDGRARTVTTTVETPSGLDFDRDGNLYYTESTHRVRKVSVSGAVETIAGTGSAGFSGDGGPAVAAGLRSPEALRVDGAGNVLVADSGNHRVRRINRSGVIDTILGGGSGYGDDWESTSVSIQIANGLYPIPGALHIDPAGTIWVLDSSSLTRMDLAQIFSNWVFNAASFERGPIAPGEIVTLFGDDLGPETLAAGAYENGMLSRQVAGTKVYFSGVEAPLVYVSRTQTSAIVPYNLGAAATVQVEYQGRRTNAITLAVGPAMPGLFTYAAGSGQIVAVNQNYQFNGAANPAAPGDWVTIFLTGQGAVTPAPADGQMPSGPDWPACTRPLQIRVGDVVVPSSEIWNGLLFQGVLQVNFRIPPQAPAGAIPVVVSVSGAASQASATLAIR